MMLPFKVKKWQLWFFIVYLSVLTSTSWYCDPSQTSCGDGATACLIKFKNEKSAKAFTWDKYFAGYCYACNVAGCDKNHEYHYDNGGVSITQKCGFRADDYIEPVCVSTLNSACPGMSTIILQYVKGNVRVDYDFLIKECPRLSTLLSEQDFKNCIEDMKVATQNAIESDDEACYNYFIEHKKCDGSLIDTKKWWTADASIPESVLKALFHITCNEENTCYDNCEDWCLDNTKPEPTDPPDPPEPTDPPNPTDNDIWTILINRPQSKSVVKADPVTFEATVSHTSGISSVALEYKIGNGSYSILPNNCTFSGYDKYSYTWNSDVALGTYTFRFVATNKNGKIKRSDPIEITVGLASVPETNNDVQINSTDRMVHITLTVPPSVKDAGIMLVNQTQTGRLNTTQKYSNLVSATAPANFMINTSIDELLSDETVEEWGDLRKSDAAAYMRKMAQEVVIVKDAAYNQATNRVLHIYAVFPELGLTSAYLTYDGKQQPVVAQNLTKNELFGQMIDLVENVFNRDFITGGGVVVASAPGLAKVKVLSQAWTAMRFGMTLSLIPVFQVAATLNNATIGFVRGFWNGICDGFDRDAQTIADFTATIIYDWHPYRWTQDFVKSFRYIITEFDNIPSACETSLDNWVSKIKASGETYVTWRYSQYSINAGVEGYYYGYGLATVAEFALVGWATSVLGSWVFSGTKSILQMSYIGEAAITTAVNALNAYQKFKLRTITFLMKEAQRATGISDEFIASVRSTISNCLDELNVAIGDPREPTKTYLDRMKQWDEWQGLYEQTGKVIHSMNDDWIRLTPIARSFAKVEARIGKSLSKEATSGLIKLHEFLWNNKPYYFKNLLGLGSRADDIFLEDLLKVFTKTDGTIHATALEESLAAYALESDKLAFVVKRFSEIHGDYAYRYLGSESHEYVINYIKEHGFHPSAQDPVWAPQVFVAQPSTREVDRLKLQILNSWNNDMKYRVRFRTSDLNGDIRLTFCRNAMNDLGCDNPKNFFEPCTRAYTAEMGTSSGGMVQLGFTIEKKVDLFEFFDETEGIWKTVPMGSN